VACLGELDCLCSLAKLGHEMNLTTGYRCRPQFVISEQKVFELRAMVHPCISRNHQDFVPNDIVLEKSKDIFLVTGPNMGGKSTLLRQVCIATIMAQVGSFVPANSFKLTTVDRIFSRIGASDRILEGKSTFFVEMEETLTIVREATNKSLVIIDELGRGTSTFDGVAIAYAVLKYIAEDVKCMTLFATHYHLLLEEFRLFDNISNYNMKCEVNKAKDEINFLYKFVKGDASNSYGIMVAKMAGLPQEIIERAKEKTEYMNKEKRNITIHQNIQGKFNKMVRALEDLEQIDEADIIDEEFLSEKFYELQDIISMCVVE